MGNRKAKKWVYWAMALFFLVGVSACAKKEVISDSEEIIVDEEIIEPLDADDRGIDEEGVTAGVQEAIMLMDAYFDFDRYNLSADAREVLRANRELLKAVPNAEILVEGHCDERGTVEYNLALGQKRAEAARDYLLSLGMTAANVSTISYGEELPQDSRSNEEAWAKNRRAHIVIIKR